VSKDEKNIDKSENKGEDKPEKGENKLEDIPDSEVLENLPEEVRRVVQIGMSMQRTSGPLPPQILSKLNDKHIDKILELSEKDDERVFEDVRQSRKYTFTYFLVFVAIFIFITIYLVGNDTDLYKEILKIFAIFAGGFGGGYGVKTYFDKK